VRRGVGVAPSVERDFWGPRATVLVRNPTSPSEQHADAPHSLALLRLRRERPRRRAAENGDELAPLHSITSSASASSPVVTKTTVR
jgi:hypothetical protein